MSLASFILCYLDGVCVFSLVLFDLEPSLSLVCQFHFCGIFVGFLWDISEFGVLFPGCLMYDDVMFPLCPD